MVVFSAASLFDALFDVSPYRMEFDLLAAAKERACGARMFVLLLSALH